MIDNNGQLPSPSTTHNQLPLESELAINDSTLNSELDRGRFPAHRRRPRGGKASRKSAGPVPDSTETPTAAQAHDHTNEAVETSTSASPYTYEVASGTMQKAMESYHGNLDPRLQSYQSPYQVSFQTRPEVVYVSGTGPADCAPPVQIDAITPVNTNVEIRKDTPNSASVAKDDVALNRAGGNISHDSPSGGTIWPEAHKWQLATAARTAITSAPANAGKRLSADEIHQILGRNPSYTELCENLEAKGYVIERGPFARTLLAAVPDLGSGRGQANNETAPQQLPISQQLPTPQKLPTSQQSPTASNFHGSTRPPTFGMLVPNKVRNPALVEVQPAAPSVYKNNNVRWADQRNATVTPSYPVTPLHNIQAPPQVPRQQPSRPPMSAPAPPRAPTKEEMARKRSFSDIVDLTQTLSDEDDYHPPSKIRRIESPQADNSILMPSVPVPLSTPLQSTSRPVSTTTKNAQTPVSSMSSNNELSKIAPTKLKSGQTSPADTRGNIDLSKYKYAPSTAPLLSKPSKREHLRSADVVRPMNRRDALRRSSYNPKTICRDILLSSGKHPTMAPLNSHLEILRINFENVDNSSDLSTFNWTLIDPGGHSGPSVLPSKSINDVEMNDADDEEAQPRVSPPAIRRRRVTVATTIDGPGAATADVAVTKPVKGIFSTRGRKKRQARVSGTESLPIDVDATEDHTPAKGPKDQDLSRQGAGAGASKNYPHMRFGEADQAISTGGAPSLRRGAAPDVRKKSFLTPTSNTAGMQSLLDTGSESERKRRGRPPGSKDKNLRKNAAILSNTDVSIRTRPGSSATDTTPARPSGLRQAMTPADGIAVVIESPRKTNDDTRKSMSESKEPRKRRKISPVNRHPSSPNHNVYKCQWKRCKSKLHNLETLRKHIRLHREAHPVGSFPCLWAGCGAGKMSKNEEGENERQPLEFETEAGWDRHMEGRHLDRYAWELGDGPSTHPSGSF